MLRLRKLRLPLVGLGLFALSIAVPSAAWAAERVTFTNGFELTCVRHDPADATGKVRLYPAGQPNTPPSETASYIDVPAASIRDVQAVASETAAEVPAPAVPSPAPSGARSDVHDLLTQAGTHHNIDVDLLAALVNAESGGRTTAVSRAGARGLMQLMPATASSLGVRDAFKADQNIAGGTTYLDRLLTRYHDDIALALAAYNAGPGAVDRFHGVPPYRETRAYVIRIVNEFNRRKRAALQTASVTASLQPVPSTH